MTIFVNKNTKTLFLVLSTILILFIIMGQLIAAVITDDYKQKMFSHDYELAGYLEQSKVDPVLIQKVFSSEKNSSELQSGENLLASAGYNKDLQENLLTNIKNFHNKYAFLLFLLSFLVAVSIIIFLFYYFIRLERKLNKATSEVNEFLNGNTNIRLEHLEEGSLSKFFNSVNGLATSLNSHIIKEKQNKEFLKETISNISHQLKTPLAALRMYNEILQEERTNNEVVTEFLEKTDRELNRMETLIKNLLKLAKLDTDSLVLNRKTGNLKSFLEELTDNFQTRAKNEYKELKLLCDGQMDLYFDEEWLYEAISNIVKNAFDHTKAQDRIDIICLETPVLKEIVITDTGSGIHPEDIHSIFKRFYRSRFSKDKQGTGIGLTLAKMIIEKHDGSITAASELGKGTTFSLVFPKLTY